MNENTAAINTEQVKPNFFKKLGKKHAFVLGLMAVYFPASAASHLITYLFYESIGIPRAVLASIIGFSLIYIFIYLHWKFHRHNVRRKTDKVTHTLYETLDQIAKGNFDVSLETDGDDRYNCLAEAINDMAKGLGNLETMRQDFMSNVSHEIQSPLTSISGFAALLQNKNLTEEDRVHYARIIEVESKRLSSLADNLLKLATLDDNKAPLSKRDFKLDKQLEHAALMLEPQWTAKNLTVEAELQTLSYCGDEDLLAQVWTNLLHNAIKFTPEGGKIGISLQTKGESAIVKVTDNGMGIAPDDQLRIFERFYKVDKARDRALGGNGLGLSLVKRTVEMHSGNIEMESVPGKGTIFTISLPQT